MPLTNSKPNQGWSYFHHKGAISKSACLFRCVNLSEEIVNGS
jgi:hypothetical protein